MSLSLTQCKASNPLKWSSTCRQVYSPCRGSNNMPPKHRSARRSISDVLDDLAKPDDVRRTVVTKAPPVTLASPAAQSRDSSPGLSEGTPARTSIGAKRQRGAGAFDEAIPRRNDGKPTVQLPLTMAGKFLTTPQAGGGSPQSSCAALVSRQCSSESFGSELSSGMFATELARHGQSEEEEADHVLFLGDALATVVASAELVDATSNGQVSRRDIAAVSASMVELATALRDSPMVVRQLRNRHLTSLLENVVACCQYASSLPSLPGEYTNVPALAVAIVGHLLAGASPEQALFDKLFAAMISMIQRASLPNNSSVSDTNREDAAAAPRRSSGSHWSRASRGASTNTAASPAAPGSGTAKAHYELALSLVRMRYPPPAAAVFETVPVGQKLDSQVVARAACQLILHVSLAYHSADDDTYREQQRNELPGGDTEGGQMSRQSSQLDQGGGAMARVLSKASPHELFYNNGGYSAIAAGLRRVTNNLRATSSPTLDNNSTESNIFKDIMQLVEVLSCTLLPAGTAATDSQQDGKTDDIPLVFLRLVAALSAILGGGSFDKQLKTNHVAVAQLLRVVINLVSHRPTGICFTTDMERPVNALAKICVNIIMIESSLAQPADADSSDVAVLAMCALINLLQRGTNSKLRWALLEYEPTVTSKEPAEAANLSTGAAVAFTPTRSGDGSDDDETPARLQEYRRGYNVANSFVLYLARAMDAAMEDEAVQRNVVSGYCALLLLLLSLGDERARVRIMTALNQLANVDKTRPMAIAVAHLQAFVLFQSEAGVLTKGMLQAMDAVIAVAVAENGIQVAASE